MDPQDYSARTDYRPPAPWYRRLNRIGVPLTSIGLAPRDAVMLRVRRRTTGRPQRIPILRTRFRGHDYLVSLAGESQWVRNVRAAEGRAALRRGRAREVRLQEVAVTDRAEIIAEYMHDARRRSSEASAAKAARFYLGLPPDAGIDDIAGIADRYPVFRVEYER